jgi:acyl carrier protein
MRQWPVQIAIAPFDLRRWQEAHPEAAVSAFFEHLRAEERTDAPAAQKIGTAALTRETVLAAPILERRSLIENYLRHAASMILGLSESRLAVDEPFKKLGMDSLMTVEFRNRIESELHVRLSATMVWNYPNISRLACHLAEKLGAALEAPVERGAEKIAITNRGVDRAAALSELTEGEAEALFMEKLSKLRGMLSK